MSITKPIYQGPSGQAFIERDLERLHEIKAALAAYHGALHSRDHGGVAADIFVKRCEAALDQSMAQYIRGG